MIKLSRALQLLAPLSCIIVDQHQQSVPLTMAGYVLRPGKSYYLQIIPPFPHEELDKVFLAAPPNYVKVDQTMKTFDKEGRSVYSIPFNIHIESKWPWERLKVHDGELSVACTFQPGLEHEAYPYQCPIIVKPFGALVVLGLILSLLVLVGQAVLGEIVATGQLPEVGFKGFFLGLATSLDSLWWVLGTLFLAVLVNSGVNLVQIYKRSRELRRRFRQEYSWEYAYAPGDEAS